MKDSKKLIKAHNTICGNLAKEFYKTYYYEDEENNNFEEDFNYYCDIINYKGFFTHINICDDYWNINNIALALLYKIPKDILHSWYSENLDACMEDESFSNLYNYSIKKTRNYS